MLRVALDFGHWHPWLIYRFDTLLCSINERLVGGAGVDLDDFRWDWLEELCFLKEAGDERSLLEDRDFSFDSGCKSDRCSNERFEERGTRFWGSDFKVADRVEDEHQGQDIDDIYWSQARLFL